MTLPEALRARLAPLADPARARAQQAYLKTEAPMLGVPRPAVRDAVRGLLRERGVGDRDAWAEAVAALWAGPERELRAAAVDWARGRRGEHLDAEALPMLEAMIREGAWWDLVDDLATHPVATVLHRAPALRGPVLRRWAADADVWVRRAALIAQLPHGADTDEALLFELCAQQAGDPSFWIRKGIGWALRQHAGVAPDAVRGFLAAQGEALSPLSRKEAEKHLR
ncbi:MAG: DNA alkylation repair protein [Myxococcota bacterium]